MVNDTSSGAPVETWTVVVDADTSQLQNEMRIATGVGRQFSSSLVTAFDGLAVKGKSFGDVLKQLTMSLSNMVVKAAFKPLDQAFGGMLQGLVGGGQTSFFASGGALSGGLPVPFAEGGVIQSPIAFPMAQGRTGLMGEAGPEAIMPLTRGADGRLGVAAAGGAAGVNVTFNVTAADAASFARSEAQLSAMLARAVTLGQRNL